MIQTQKNKSKLAARRSFLQRTLAWSLVASGATVSIGAEQSTSSVARILQKQIPATGERLPCIGMGSWITFDIPEASGRWMQRVKVLRQFFDHGGGMIDSSPMYGNAEELIGFGLAKLGIGKSVGQSGLFAASKIWTPAGFMRGSQMANTESLWGVQPMDLMFVHNLLAWKKHLPVLQDWKASGRIRYIGVSTSHGRRHQELESVMRSESLDFIQLTMNIEQTEAEKRLLPLAADRGMAVVVNRPFQRGALFDRYQSRPLPALAAELGCENWAQFFLLYIVSHPAVTCAIPATSREDHMRENMRTMRLALPGEKLREEMRKALV